MITLRMPFSHQRLLDIYSTDTWSVLLPIVTTVSRHFILNSQVYNLVGMVCGHDEDDGSAVIEVEFLDTAIHHSFTIANHDGYTMACLSEAALVLASEVTEDNPRSVAAVPL